MKTRKRPRDIAERAVEIGEESTGDSAESVDELVTAFWEETGVIAPMVEIKPPLTDKWGEDERWRQWRKWLVRRKMGGGKVDRRAAGRLGGLKGGRARARALSAEERSEIARKAAATRWARAKDDDK